MNDTHPVVNLIWTVKLVSYVNYGTKIISNIKYNNTAEAVIEAEGSGGQALCHSAVHSGAWLVQTRGQVLEFRPAHVSVVPEEARLIFAAET